MDLKILECLFQCIEIIFHYEEISTSCTDSQSGFGPICKHKDIAVILNEVLMSQTAPNDVIDVMMSAEGLILRAKEVKELVKICRGYITTIRPLDTEA